MNLLRELRHPRVVLLMGVCTSSQRPLMVLEYMNAGSLYGYLHDNNRFVDSLHRSVAFLCESHIPHFDSEFEIFLA